MKCFDCVGYRTYIFRVTKKKFEISNKIPTSLQVAGKDLANALQYGKTEGDAKLLKFWKGLLNKMYAPSRNVERRTLVTNGAELGTFL